MAKKTKKATKKTAKKATKKVSKKISKKVSNKKPTKTTLKTSAKPKTAYAFVSPTENRVLVVLKVEAQRTPGGLYIPEMAASDGPQEGSVLAVGPGLRNKKGQRKALDVSAGDRVLFDKHSGSRIFHENQEYRILNEDEIIGIIDHK